MTKVNIGHKTKAFSFSTLVDGTATGTYNMKEVLPASAIVEKVYIKCDTTLASADSTATVQIKVAGGTILLAPTVITAFPASGHTATVDDIVGTETAGAVLASQDGVSVSVLSAPIDVVIGVEALTAGVFTCIIEYVEVYPNAVN